MTSVLRCAGASVGSWAQALRAGGGLVAQVHPPGQWCHPGASLNPKVLIATLAITTVPFSMGCGEAEMGSAHCTAPTSC